MTAAIVADDEYWVNQVHENRELLCMSLDILLKYYALSRAFDTEINVLLTRYGTTPQFTERLLLYAL